jgi:MSHA biogenesis protein MshN
MSIINQMLRDLDARHASEQERAGLPPRLRTLPPRQVARGGDWRMLVAGMLAGGALVGIAASWYFSPGAQPPAPVPAPVATPAPPAPTVPPAPTFASPAVPAAAPLPTPAEEARDMKLSTLLAAAQPETPATSAAKPAAPPVPAPKLAAAAKAPEAARPSATVPAPEPKAAPPAVKPVTEPARPARETRPAPLPAAEPALPDAQIDKRAKGGQAHEMADGEYRKGMQAVKRGDNAGAVPLFRHALELDPGHARSRQALLSVLVGARQWAEAQQAAKSGLALDPAQTGWATILARLQFEQGNAAAAIATLENYAVHAGGDAEYQGLFAYLLQKQQRPAEAAQRFRIALALRPGEGRWWFGLGLALEAAGQGGEAKEAYAKAREVGNLPADMQAVVEQKTK